MHFAAQYVQATSTSSVPLYNPSTGAFLLALPESSSADVDAAVAAAARAQPHWASLGALAWGTCMRKLAELIRRDATSLMALESLCMGKPSNAPDAIRAAAMIETLAGQAVVTHGESSITTPGQVAFSLRVPFGVTAAIVPWNNAILLSFNKVAPALLAGNTIVLKPSERCPLSLIKIASLFKEAGFPDGVFNLVNGGEDVGTMLTTHMAIRKLSFTGSIKTGRKVVQAAANSNMKKIVLEMGGKNPSIIFDDADVDAAVAATEFSMVYNCGQVCMANTRIYVQRGIADRFIDAFQKRYTARAPGDPFSATPPPMGPVVDRRAHDTIRTYVEEAKAAGARALTGSIPSGDGFFIPPTILLDLPHSSRPAREEIFGPVVSITVFETDDQVLELANDSEYGLYASIFTQDMSRGMRFARSLETGTVAINQTSPTIAMDMPFGGMKQSGWDYEFGQQSIARWTHEKSILIKV